MKSGIIKDTVREIKKTKSKFMSIFGIVAIGVAFFAGLMASAPVMRWNADRFFDECNLADYRILSNFGLTQRDIDDIKNTEGVEAVSAAYEKDVLVSVGSSMSVMRVHSLDLDHMDENDPEYINKLVLIEGRLPQKSGEMVVEHAKLLENSFKIGDKVTITSGDGEDIHDTFAVTEYTVVGIVETSYYLSYEKGSSSIGSGSVNVFAYVPACDFDMEVYTQAFVTASGAKDINSYDREYFDFIEPLTARLKKLGKTNSDIRRRDIMDEAMEKYNDGLKEYEDGVKEFDRQIAAAEKKIEDGRDEITKGEILLETNKALGEYKLESRQTQIDTYKETLKQLKEYYAELEKAYNDNYGAVIEQRDRAQAEYEAAKRAQDEKQLAYDEAKSVYDTLVRQNEEYYTLKDRETALQTEILTVNGELRQLRLQLAVETDEEKKAEIQTQIDEKTALLTEKENELTATQTRISDFETANPDLAGNLATAQSNLDTAQRELASAQAETEAKKRTVDGYDRTLETARAGLDAMDSQIKSVENQISDGERQIAAGRATLTSEIAAAQRKLTSAKIELEKGEKELEEKRAEGQKELDDAREELVKAKAEIDAIAEAEWYVLDRESMYSYMDYRGATERMDAISAIFPLFFFAVAALVCLTTMTRMVDEQRTRIGTLKALGYSAPEIAFKYIFYAFFASLTGAIVGLAFGSVAFPFVIYTAWNMMYNLPVMVPYFIPKIMIVSGLAIVTVTTAAAFSACYGELVETPAVLMRPKTPKLGKKILLERIKFIWNRLSFTSKVTARNLFRYKKRFFMTVIGIAGCTALLVTGWGIKDSIGTLVSTQFGDLFHYDGTARLSADITAADREKLVKDLKKDIHIDDVFEIGMNSSEISYGGETIDVTLTTVSDAEEFEKFSTLRERKSGERLNLSDEGAIITEHTADLTGAGVGDTVTVVNPDGIKAEVQITGICEGYIGHYVYMTEDCYKDIFKVSAKPNTLLIAKAEGISDEAVAEILSNRDGIDTLGFYSGTINNFNNMIKSLDLIVIVIIVSSGALAFVVLFNLTNVNVSERMREIATLKVLGFREREVESYIFRENLILTFIGSIAGLFVGKWLHRTIMVMVELDTVMFGRNIEPLSYALSVAITLVFALIVNFVMKKRLANVQMVESLKSVE